MGDDGKRAASPNDAEEQPAKRARSSTPPPPPPPGPATVGAGQASLSFPAAAPDARVYAVAGNHEARRARQGLREQPDLVSYFLRRLRGVVAC